MEVRLRVRIDIDRNPVAKNKPEVYRIYKQDVIQAIAGYKERAHQRITRADIARFCSDFSASITMVRPTRIEDLDIPANKKYTYDYDRTARIAVAEIELNTHLRDDSELIPKRFKAFSYVVEAAKNMLEVLSPDLEFVIIKDHLTKTISVQSPIERSETFIYYSSQIELSKKCLFTDVGYRLYLSNFKRPRYRFYLDGILLMERYYPDLDEHQQLEENIYLMIDPGVHQVYIDNFGDRQILITDIAVHGTIIPDINADTCSFDIR